MKEITRSTIARLLATENITVVQDNVSTASFDVKNRVLRLPSWSDVASFTEDHLIGHEVGHALYTPLDGWHDAVCEHGSSYKSYLNVVEDARIEKLIQRKYPGLRASFVRSYNKMFRDGFFGADLKTVNKMTLIDRLNVYFKCGQSLGVRFEEHEKIWINEMSLAETWEQVVDITDRLFELALEEREQQRAEEEQEEGDGEDELDDTDASSGEMEEGESGESDEFDGPSGEGDDFDDLFDDEFESEYESLSSDDGGIDGSQTDQILRDKIADEITDREWEDVYNMTVNIPSKWSKQVIGFKKLISHLKLETSIHETPYGDYRKELEGFGTPFIENVGGACYSEWMSVNKKAVNHMVKEFEMRKSASEHARALTAKTGVIDTVKMNNYKMTDDIFKKVTIVPEGKNHGFIMYLDMSGSMSDYMYQTVEQCLLLAHFARQINVPFRVYGFTSTMRHESKTDHDELDKKLGSFRAIHTPQECHLLELMSNEMSRSEMAFMSKALLSAFVERRFRKNHEYRSWALDNNLSMSRIHNRVDPLLILGGTPLNHALVLGMPLAVEFRKAHRIDILNTILLTDGSSHDLECKTSAGTNNYDIRWLDPSASLMTYTCPINNKTYRVKSHPSRRGDQTDALMEMYKDVTGSNLIGYRIEHHARTRVLRTYRVISGRMMQGWEVEQDLMKQFRTDGWMKVDNPVGYDECYVLSAKSLKIEDNQMEELRDDASKARIRNAFKKSTGNSRKSRKMLTDIVEKCA